MSLIKCVECGKEFSDKAKACPECACPTEYILNELEKQIKMIEYECENCGKHFSQDLDKCPYCKTSFEEQDEKKYPEKYMCPYCDEIFDVDVDECPFCGAKFNIDDEVSNEEHTNIEKIKCESCGTFFDANLKKCPKCSIKFIEGRNNKSQKQSITSKCIISGILLLMIMSSYFNKYRELYGDIYDFSDPEVESIILKSVLLNTLFVSLIMMIVPLILWIKDGCNLSYKKAKDICIKNSLILFIISIISKITFDYGFIGGLGSIVYYFINMTLFSNKKTSN